MVLEVTEVNQHTQIHLTLEANLSSRILYKKLKSIITIVGTVIKLFWVFIGWVCNLKLLLEKYMPFSYENALFYIGNITNALLAPDEILLLLGQNKRSTSKLID